MISLPPDYANILQNTYSNLMNKQYLIDLQNLNNSGLLVNHVPRSFRQVNLGYHTPINDSDPWSYNNPISKSTNTTTTTTTNTNTEDTYITDLDILGIQH